MCNVRPQSNSLALHALSKHYVFVNVRNLRMRLGFEQTAAKIYAEDKCLCGGILNNTTIHKTMHKPFFFYSVNYTQQVFLFHKFTIQTGNCGLILLIFCL